VLVLNAESGMLHRIVANVADVPLHQGEKRGGIGMHQDKDRDFPVGGPIMTHTLCEPGGERTLEVTKWEHKGESVTLFNRKLQREIAHAGGDEVGAQR
jgi:hypothetical protein